MVHIHFAPFLIILTTSTHALLTASTPSQCTNRYRRNDCQRTTAFHGPSSKTWPMQNSNPLAVNGGGGSGRSSPIVIELKAGFLDDLFKGNFFGDSSSDTLKRGSGDDEQMKDTTFFSEIDFRKEVQKRSGEGTGRSATTIVTDTKDISVKEGVKEGDNDDNEFDGYALRDAIYAKWGYYFDIDFQPVQSFGFKELYLNVLPYRMGGKKFRHETEYDYLCHLQAVVEILLKYDQLDIVLTQLEETKKKPRAGTVPIIAVPFRLDLTEDELDAILA